MKDNKNTRPFQEITFEQFLQKAFDEEFEHLVEQISIMQSLAILFSKASIALNKNNNMSPEEFNEALMPKPITPTDITTFFKYLNEEYLSNNIIRLGGVIFKAHQQMMVDAQHAWVEFLTSEKEKQNLETVDKSTTIH